MDEISRLSEFEELEGDFLLARDGALRQAAFDKMLESYRLVLLEGTTTEVHQVLAIVAELFWHCGNSSRMNYDPSYAPFQEKLQNWCTQIASEELRTEVQGALSICIADPFVEVPVDMKDFNWLLSLLDHPKANWLVRSAFCTDQTDEEWAEVYRTYAEWCHANDQIPLAPTIGALRELCRWD